MVVKKPNTDGAGRRVAKKGEAPRANLVEKDITPVMDAFVDYIKRETGYDADPRSVQLGAVLRGDFQKSPENQKRIADRKAELEAEAEAREERAAERERKRAEKAAAPAKEKPAPKSTAKSVSTTAKTKAAAASAKPAASKRPVAKTAPVAARRRPASKPASDGDDF